MFEIKKTKQYKKDEKKHPELSNRLERMEKHLQENPTHKSGTIDKIEGEEIQYRYRIGGYRIFYEVFAQTVTLQKIKPRGEAYKE